jgi:hypothetical protein
VDWAVTGSGASAADATDFGGSAHRHPVLRRQRDHQTISITVASDLDVEFDEGFTVTISNAKLSDNTPQNIVDATATGRIVNDDQRFSVSAANAAITEGNSGTTQVAYTVTRTRRPQRGRHGGLRRHRQQRRQYGDVPAACCPPAPSASAWASASWP